MARGTRPKTDIDARRREIGRLYLKGNTQPEIASELEISQATVSRDLKKLRELWIASALVDINDAKSKELAKIDMLELEYWQAWKRSIGDRIRESTKANASSSEGLQNLSSPRVIEKTVHKEISVGDPRFLAGVQWCIDKRCKILGLDAPQLVEVSWQDEIIELLEKGEIDPDQVKKDFGELAYDLFEKAGITIATPE